MLQARCLGEIVRGNRKENMNVFRPDTDTQADTFCNHFDSTEFLTQTDPANRIAERREEIRSVFSWLQNCLETLQRFHATQSWNITAYTCYTHPKPFKCLDQKHGHGLFVESSNSLNRKPKLWTKHLDVMIFGVTLFIVSHRHAPVVRQMMRELSRQASYPIVLSHDNHSINAKCSAFAIQGFKGFWGRRVKSLPTQEISLQRAWDTETLLGGAHVYSHFQDLAKK